MGDVLTREDKDVFKNIYNMAVMYWNPNGTDEYWNGLLERQRILANNPLGEKLSRAIVSFLTVKYEREVKPYETT